MTDEYTETPQPAPATPPPAPQAPPMGAVTAGLTDPRRKSPLFSAVLSLMPGLGQVYVGYYQRGFIHAIVAASLVALLASGSVRGLEPLFGLFLAFFWLYNVVDAFRRALLYNHALAGGKEINLPDDFQVPGFRGTVVGGVALALVGFVLLAHTRFGASLAWIEEWWPAAFIVFGGYLVWKAIQDKAGNDSSPYEEDTAE